MGPLDAVRDFVALGDVLSAVERVIDRAVWGEVVNVCTGVGRPARSLLESVTAPLEGAVAIDEAVEAPGGPTWSVGDPARCEARLGFRPSADLSDLARAAADWIMGEAAAHARSRA
jgi:nucleoside-diphosphate-sugar epimerase